MRLVSSAVAVGLVWVVMVTGCSKPSASASSPTGFVTDGASTLWPDRQHIPVCWENLQLADAGTAAEVQALVAQQYGPVGFTFVGWQACTASSRGIRIDVVDSGTRVLAFGAYLDGLPSGMHLNFVFSSWQWHGIAICSGAERLHNCILSYALHEFGHGLGMRHEANRPDGSCQAEDQNDAHGEPGALVVDAYDAQSIMNYCFDFKSLRDLVPPTISAGDITTLTKYYGGGVAFSPLDQGAACRASGFPWDSLNGCCEAAAGQAPAGAMAGVSLCRSPEAQCTSYQGTWNAALSCCTGAVRPASDPSFLEYGTCS